MAAPSLEISPSLLKKIRDNPQAVQDEMDRRRGNLSLSNYSAAVWSVLEPKRPLIRGPSWECICDHLEAVGNGEIRKLLINVPPGFSKSLLSNVFFPTYQWGPKNRPDQRFVGFSYSKDLTLRDNRKALLLVQSDIYQRNWGDRFTLASEAKGRFDTDVHGFKFASSTGGIGTGERGDFLIVDDPNNVKTVESDVIRNETLFWFSEVLPTRLNDPEKSAIIVIQQRTHESDVSGLILAKELGFEWCCLPMEYTPGRRCFTPVRRKGVPRRRVRLVKLQEDSVPTWLDAKAEVPDSAEMVGPVRLLTSQDWRKRKNQLVAPERFSRRHIEKDLKPQLRAVGGSYAESGQLDQKPTPRGGGLFQKADFNIIEFGELPDGIAWVRGYDLAASETSTSPYSANVKIGVHDGKVYISDADRIRGKPGKVEKWMVDQAEADGYGVAIDFPQDPGQAGKSQKSYLGGKFQGYDVYSSTETGAKETRARLLAAQSELGNLYLVRGPWTGMWMAEATRFPRSDFKDLVDASSRGYARAILLEGHDVVPSAPQIIRGG